VESKIYTQAVKPAAGKATVPTAAEVLINRQAHALLDPAFPWQYAKAFAELHQPLPVIVNEPYIRMAFEYLSGRVNNDDIVEAQVIQHPKWATKRGFLEALLLFPNLRLDEVAAHTGLAVSVVMTYAALFWSVRDRLEDKLFINELCFPATRLPEYQDGYWDSVTPRELMLRAAFNKDLATVLQLFGVKAQGELESAETSANQVKASTMADAAFVVRAGGAGSTVPVLNAARRMISASEKFAMPTNNAGDDLIGLTALSLDPGQSILATLQGLCGPTLRVPPQDAPDVASN
jgi:hypothetical protein